MAAPLVTSVRHVATHVPHTLPAPFGFCMHYPEADAHGAMRADGLNLEVTIVISDSTPWPFAGCHPDGGLIFAHRWTQPFDHPISWTDFPIPEGTYGLTGSGETHTPLDAAGLAWAATQREQMFIDLQHSSVWAEACLTAYLQLWAEQNTVPHGLDPALMANLEEKISRLLTTRLVKSLYAHSAPQIRQALTEATARDKRTAPAPPFPKR